MQGANVKNMKTIELEKFSENSSKLLHEQGRLAAFFESLDYDVIPNGKGFKAVCPSCKRSYCFIGVNGHKHFIYWKCHDSTCPSNQMASGVHHNLLGLVYLIVEAQERRMGVAIETIAEFLGYAGRS